MKHQITVEAECWYCGGVRCGCGWSQHNRYHLCSSCYRAVTRIVKSHGDFIGPPGVQTRVLVLRMAATFKSDDGTTERSRFFREIALMDPHPVSVHRN